MNMNKKSLIWFFRGLCFAESIIYSFYAMKWRWDGTEAVPYGVIFAGCVFCTLLQLIVSAS